MKNIDASLFLICYFLCILRFVIHERDQNSNKLFFVLHLLKLITVTHSRLSLFALIVQIVHTWWFTVVHFDEAIIDSYTIELFWLLFIVCLWLPLKVADYLGVSPVIGKLALKSEFLRQICESSVLHIATYGSFEKGKWS